MISALILASLVTVNVNIPEDTHQRINGALYAVSNAAAAAQGTMTNAEQWTSNRVKSQEKTSSELWAVWGEIKPPLMYAVVGYFVWLGAKWHKRKGEIN
jgi:hypothetical protein